MGALVLGAASQGVAAAATASSDGNFNCTGSLASPGVLAGSYGDVSVTGTCVVNAGSAVVHGDLTIAPGGALAAIFGQNDLTSSGNSDLTVQGDLIVQSGGSLMLGCYSLEVTVWGVHHLVTVPDFPCADDPNPNVPTLNTHDVIDGDLIANNALGVVVHQTVIHGDLIETGGGAGLGCAAVGIFDKYFGLPEYSDFANTSVGGDMKVTGLDTCWYGLIRNTVHGDMTSSDNLSLPDAGEVVNNTVYGDLSCQNNDPAVELGDSDGSPNLVGGDATGQCGFDVILPNPAPNVGVLVPPTFQPASVPLH
jgi:hypothetical protein